MLNGVVYLPGDSVLITDIGVFNGFGAASSLVCHTSNVNTQCCRLSDGGRVGEWFFPNGSMVLRNNSNQNLYFTRSGFTHQVRLNRRIENAPRIENASTLELIGEYSCRVPDERNSTFIHIASINLALSK